MYQVTITAPGKKEPYSIDTLQSWQGVWDFISTIMKPGYAYTIKFVKPVNQ